MLAGSVLFVLGFAAVFVAIGTAAGSLGSWLVVWQREITVVLGILTIVLGLMFAGLVPGLQRDWRIHKVPAVGLAAAPAAGLPLRARLVAVPRPDAGASSPTCRSRRARPPAVRCSAASMRWAWGCPFIGAALAYRRALAFFAVIRRHQQWVTRIGGLMLVLVGVLLVTGAWDWVVQWLQIRLVNDFEVPV